jgi:hydrogenase maturation protease
LRASTPARKKTGSSFLRTIHRFHRPFGIAQRKQQVFLMTSRAKSVRIVGCGRSAMTDDRAGLVAAQQLLKRNLPCVEVVATEAPTAELADERLAEVGLLVVVDAAEADDRHPVGSNARFDYQERPEGLRRRAQTDTHGISVDAGLALAASLGILPPAVWIYVLFGQCFDRGLEMGAAGAGIGALVDRIERDVRAWTESRPDSGDAC